ncbi:hypothetical protein V6N13_073975 [Hibiscus sabdariffa]|uniref:Uncharacterized protein n=1 Tax=Hibiscus sabdariffa TaxID=183260 RepID=A0ABR2U7I4_9ROSI
MGIDSKGSNNFQNQMTNQFKNMHFDVGKDNTPQRGGGGGKNNQQKGESECDFDEFGDKEFDEGGFQHGHGHEHQMQNKMVPMIRKGHDSYRPSGMVNGPHMNGKKGGGGSNGKKGDALDISIMMKGKGENKDRKHGNERKKRDGGKNKGGKHRGGGLLGFFKKDKGANDCNHKKAKNE